MPNSVEGNFTEPRIRLSVLGGFNLQDSEGNKVHLVNQKACALISYLVLTRSKFESRERLAGLLWSERDEERARASLRQTLKQLRAMFRDIGFEGFQTDRRDVLLQADRIDVDLFDMMSQLEAGDLPVPLAEARGDPKDMLYGFESLDQSFTTWLQGVRVNWHNRIIEELGRRLATAPTSKVKETAEALLHVDPAHELAHRQLISHYASVGNIAAALSQYKLLWDLLDEEHDMEPDEATQALISKIKSGQFESAASPQSTSVSRQILETNANAAADDTVENMPPILWAESVSSTEGLEAFVAESIKAQLSRTAVGHARISVLEHYGRPVCSVVAPGTRCVIYVTENDDKMMVLARLTHEPSGRFFWSRRLSFDAADELAAIDAGASLALEATEAVAACTDLAGEAAIANAMAAEALQKVFSFDAALVRQADKLLAHAHEIDPHASRPALRALAKAYLAVEQTGSEIEETKEEAKFLSSEALSSGAESAIVMAFLADVHDLVFEDAQTALSYAKIALEMDAGTGYAHASLGALELRRGRAKEAFLSARRAKTQLQNTSLQPFSNLRYCLAAMSVGRFAEAINAAKRAAILAPNSRPPLRHLYALQLHNGDREGAFDTLTKLRRLEPDFSMSRIRDDPAYPASVIRSLGLERLPDVEH